MQIRRRKKSLNWPICMRNGQFAEIGHFGEFRSYRSNILLGSYISAADVPYSQRALPPSNLDTNPSPPDFPYDYHIYKVLKPLTVVGGPIAPWFGQPGLGTQFYTSVTGNNMALIAAGYLERLSATVLISGSDKECSWRAPGLVCGNEVVYSCRKWLYIIQPESHRCLIPAKEVREGMAMLGRTTTP